MTFKVGILGGGLQGTEAAALVRWAGWESVLVDKRPQAPASGITSHFLAIHANSFKNLDQAFGGCDLIVPACEDLATLELLSSWSQVTNAPVAFDLASYQVSSDKIKSKELFQRVGAPIAAPWPHSPYPLIAKPAASSGSRGVKLLESQADFQALFGQSTPLPGWVVEEYCPGPSYSLEVTGRPGQYQAWLTTALEMDSLYDCREVRSPACLSPENEAIFRQISINIAQGLGLRGLMDVEVILSPSGFRVLEIDARLPSQTPSVVWWSLGENLIVRLAADFCGIVAPKAALSPLRAVVYEQVQVEGQHIVSAGEHIMASLGPLTLHENFFGADWALTNYQPGQERWSAILITIGSSPEEVEARRAETAARISQGQPR